MKHGATDNAEKSRYELVIDGHTAFADYQKNGDTLTINWVEAPPALRGTGAAGKLMEAIVEEAEACHQRIHPVCGYAASWLKRHTADDKIY